MTKAKREGVNPVGRPPIENPATKRINVKVTPEQHATWVRWNASSWLKKMLDELKDKSP